MSTLQVRVEDYTGTVADTTALTDQLVAGCKLIVNSIPEDKLDRYSSPATESGSGVDITSVRPFRAHKSGYRAILIPAELKTQAGLTGSIYYATTTSPQWYIEDGKAYVLPSGGTILSVSFPTGVTYASTAISGFPTQWEHGAVLYTAIQQLIGKSNASLDSLQALSMDSVTAPTAPAAPSFTYTDVTWTDALIDTITATSIGSLGSAPVYTKPTTTFSVTTATTYIGTNEDGDLASAELQKQAALLDQFGKDLYNELNEVNAEIEAYKLSVQKVLDQAQLDQQRLMKQSEMQVELNKFNEDKTLEKEIVNKTKDLEKQIQQYSASIQKYLGQINSYQGDIQAAVQKYANNIQKYSVSLSTNGQTIKNLQEEFNRILSAI